MPDDAVSAIAARAGRYRGDGVRYGGVAFAAEIELRPVLDGRGVALTFVAREDGAVIHREETLVARDPQGRPALWTFHTNTEGVWHQPLRGERVDDGARTFLFGVGDVTDPASLRTEIAIELFDDGSLGHRRTVGVAGGEFLDRSRTRARRVPSFDVWHVAVPVTDLDRSVAFWCGRLGFVLLGRDESEERRQAYVAVREGGFAVALFEPLGDAAEQQPRRPDRLAFECDDLEGFREAIGEPGTVNEFANGVRHLRVVDPDGVALDFYEGRAIYERDSMRPATT